MDGLFHGKSHLFLSGWLGRAMPHDELESPKKLYGPAQFLTNETFVHGCGISSRWDDRSSGWLRLAAKKSGPHGWIPHRSTSQPNVGSEKPHIQITCVWKWCTAPCNCNLTSWGNWGWKPVDFRVSDFRPQMNINRNQNGKPYEFKYQPEDVVQMSHIPLSYPLKYWILKKAIAWATVSIRKWTLG